MSKVTAMLAALVLLCALTVFALSADGAPAEAPPVQITAEESQAFPMGLEELQTNQFEASGYSYPSCGVVHGTPCQQGQIARCQWTPYEPEVCTCPNGTFKCGSLP